MLYSRILEDIVSSNFNRSVIKENALIIRNECYRAVNNMRKYNVKKSEAIEEIVNFYPICNAALGQNKNFFNRIIDFDFIHGQLKKECNLLKVEIHQANIEKEISAKTKGLSWISAKKEQKRIVSKYTCASSVMLNRRNEQLLEKDEYLKNVKLISEDGSILNLDGLEQEFNKKFARIYMQMKSIEEKATKEKKIWLFLTMTCPPEVVRNPLLGDAKWDGTTAKEANKLLLSKWNKFKKRLASKGLKMTSGDIYGFRVTEPHKSGVPHLHAMIFVNSWDVKVISEELIKAYDYNNQFTYFDENTNSYARLPDYDIKINKVLTKLKEDFEYDNRAIKIVVDNQQERKIGESASASSYVIKYLVKNVSLDGNFDKLTKEQITNKKIDAWKSCLNIRSFAIIGLKGYITLWESVRKTSWSQIWQLNKSTCVNDLKTLQIIMCAKGFLFTKSLSKVKSVLSVDDSVYAVPSGIGAHQNYQTFVELLEESNVKMIKKTRINKYGESVREVKAIEINAVLIEQFVYEKVVQRDVELETSDS